MPRWYHMFRMDPQAVLRARIRAFFWPPSGPLRRLATINAALWGIMSFIDLMQPHRGDYNPLFYGPLLGGISWVFLRLCVTDHGGRLASRLPFRWMHAKGGRALFGLQGLITLYLAQHDLVNWAAHPVLQVAGDDLAAGALILGCTWGIPAATVAVVSQARLVAAGQTGGGDQPPPHGQQQGGEQGGYQGQQEQWEYTQQDIPQDEAWTQPPPGAQPPPPIHDAAWACSVLHVHQGASLEQIERVYKNLAAMWHPDRAQSTMEHIAFEKQMTELNEAITLLRATKRSAP